MITFYSLPQLNLSLFLAKPKLKNDIDESSKRPRIRLGDDVTLKSPFENAEHYKWLKNGEPFINQTLDIMLANVSRSSAGNNEIMQ